MKGYQAMLRHGPSTYLRRNQPVVPYVAIVNGHRIRVFFAYNKIAVLTASRQ
jgi:hypothetical protein